MYFKELFKVTTTKLAIEYLHKSKRSLKGKCFGNYNVLGKCDEHLAVLVKPRQKNKHGLNKVGHWAIWADKADGTFWNILESIEFYPRVFLSSGQVQ